MKYDLKKTFKCQIAGSGDLQDAEYLEFTAPTNTVLKEATLLEKELFKAIKNMSNDVEEDGQKTTDNDKKLKGEEVVLALTAGDANLEKCYDALKKIMQKNCLVNGSGKFVHDLFEKLDYVDTKNILGEYISSFLLTSLVS